MSPQLSGSALPFSQRTRHARKLLVVDFGFLGDSVQLVPTLWELKRHHPSAELHVLTTRVGGEVLRLAPCVDRIWDLELMPDRRTLSEQLRVLRGLRREHFDAAFNFSGSDRTVFWTRFSGAQERMAHAWGSHHFWTRWLIPDLVSQQDPNLLVAEQRRRVLAELGFETGPLRYELKPDAAAMKRAEDIVPTRAIHLSINAAKPLKEWPLQHSAELTGRILREYPDIQVVASGSFREREQQRLRQLKDRVNHSNLCLLPPDLRIAELAAVLQRCRLHIGPDSGVMNLAVAMEVPTISFFRDQPGYKAWVPQGRLHRPFIGACHCVDHHHAPCLAAERAECLAAITVKTVFQAVREALDIETAGIIPQQSQQQ